MDTTSTEFEILVDPPRTRSFYCGDGVVDPLLEECDDGFAEGADGDATSDAASVCSPNCQTRDVLAVTSTLAEQVKARRLGVGRHPLAGGGDAHLARRGALVFVEPGDPQLAAGTPGSAPRIVVRILDAYGNPAESILIADAATPVLGGTPTSTSDPVVAVTRSGTVAVLYDELNGDGSERGIALRTIQWPTDEVPEPGSGELGAARFINQTTIGAQQSADLVWTGSELVAAWLDTSDAETGPDLRYRVFGSEGEAIGSEDVLAASGNPEGAVALTAWTREAGSGVRHTWAAAWRESLPAGNEAIVVAGEGASVRIEPGLVDGTLTNIEGLDAGGLGGSPAAVEHFGPGQAHDRPALAPLDDEHLAVVFTVGTDPEGTGVASVGRLIVAVVDVTLGEVLSLDFVEPLAGGEPWDAARSLEQPVLVAATDPADDRLPTGSVFLGWRSAGALGSATGEDLWLKRLDWEAGSLSLDLEEVPWVRDSSAPWAHSLGDQRVPALGDFAVPGGGAVGMVWEDWGSRLSPAQSKPDIALQIAPLPVRRGPPVERECSEGSCGVGEGPCETSADCESGLECAERAGPFYGYGPETAVCRPSTCAEEDCGGACGGCFECPDATAYQGTAHYCSAVCPCADRAGDCDSDFDCSPELTCAESTGELVGYAEPIDLCLVPHCINEAQDEGETRADCGGADCVKCLNGQPDYCAGAEKCAVGEGNCNDSTECASGLVCSDDVAEYYGLPDDVAVCHEAACPATRSAPQSPDSCSEACKCVSGQGSCSSDAECTSGYCRPRAGLYYGEHVDLAVCQPAYCHNGVKDTNETDTDCGGACGSECPACEDDATFRSFEYDVDSTQPAGFRGIERSSGTALTWLSSSTLSSDASKSVAFSGCGVATVVSPWFGPEEFQIVGSELALDVQPRTLDGQPVPGSVTALGSVTLRVQRPYPASTLTLGTFAFSRGDENHWTKHTAAVSADLRALFLEAEGEANDEMRFEWTVEISCQAPQLALHLDNLRFGGDAVFRSECGAGAGQGTPGPSASLFGFEDVAKWSSVQATPTLATGDVRQGTHALTMPPSDHQLVSAPFSPAGLGADRKLLVDVKLPAAPTALSGSVQASLSCPSVGLVGVSLGIHNVATFPRSKWLTLPFSLTATQVTDLGAFPRDCRLTIGTTLSGAASGEVIKYDDLRFAPLGHCSSYVQSDDAPFALGMGVTPNGSTTYPYRLCVPEQVQSVMNTSSLWAATFLLEQDIDLTGVSGAIGTQEAPFTGVFNGQGHTLRNFIRHAPSSVSVGLFGWIDPAFVPSETAGAVLNLTIDSFDVSGPSSVGALVGTNEGFISNITAQAPAVSGSGANVGGVIGTNGATAQSVTVNGPTVVCGASSCGAVIGSSGGTVNGAIAVGGTISGAGTGYGGIVGTLGGQLSNALSSTAVLGTSASSDVGGLAGVSNGNLTSSSASGAVIGGVRVGGAVGSAATGSLSSVSASGRVEGLASTSHAGGLIGLVSGISVSDCGATGPVFGRSVTGGFAGEVADGASVLRATSSGAVTHLAGESAGGFVGRLVRNAAASTPRIQLATASGTVSGIQYVGGFVGTSQAGVIRTATATGNVTGSNQAVGGFAGRLIQDSTLTRAKATGTVANTSTRVGGLVGEVSQSTVLNSYSTSAVSGTGDVGGLVGRTSGGRVERSYSTGVVGGSGTRGAVIGFFGTPTRLSKNFGSSAANPSLAAVGNIAAAPGVTLLSTADLAGPPTSPLALSDWDFNYTWANATGGPTFRPDVCLEYAQTSSAPFVTGLPVVPDGTLARPYPICSVTHLGSVFSAPSQSYLVEQNLDLTGVSTTTGVTFTGSLRGGGYTISKYQRVGTANVGFFASVASSTVPAVSGLYLSDFAATGTSTFGLLTTSLAGTVRDVHVSGTVNATGINVGGLVGLVTSGSVQESTANVAMTISGSGNTGVGVLVGRLQGGGSVSSSSTQGYIGGSFSYSGGLVGRIATGTVTTSSSSVTLDTTGSGGSIGGLIGEARDGSITDSLAAGSVANAPGEVGGLIGSIDNFDITRCSASTTVNASGSSVGGLVGVMETTPSDILESSASGSVYSAGSFVGGLVGLLSKGTVHRSFATGNATAAGSGVGGLIGRAETATMVTNSRASGAATSTSGSEVGGLVGWLYIADVYDCYATGSVQGTNNEGGLVGRSYASKIRRSYSTGSVNTTGYNGAFVGSFFSPAECTSCFYKTSSNPGMASHESGTSSPLPVGLSDANMTNQSAFTGFNFTTTWIMGASGPVLR